ncbi:hypothetical protein ACLB2K_065349 [Fragaria x ananassa]
MTLEASLAVADGPPEPKIVNIVSTVNLGCKLDLKMIAMKARNAEYNPKRFHAVIIRIKEPKTTSLVFSSGKIVVTGAKSYMESKQAARKYFNTVKKTGFEVSFKDFKVQNIVANCKLNYPIRLETLAHSETLGLATYEAELFPGLIYRVLKPKVVFIVFAPGNIIITGAKIKEDTDKAWELMYPLIAQHGRPVNFVPSSIVASPIEEKSAPKRGKKRVIEASSSASGSV